MSSMICWQRDRRKKRKNLIKLAEMDETRRLVKLPTENWSIRLQLFPLFRCTDSVYEICPCLTLHLFRSHQCSSILLGFLLDIGDSQHSSPWRGFDINESALGPAVNDQGPGPFIGYLDCTEALIVDQMVQNQLNLQNPRRAFSVDGLMFTDLPRFP